MPRKRFNRNTIASSRGSYVRKAHLEYLKEVHERNKEVLAEISITVSVKHDYYVRCFGKLIKVTEEEAMKLSQKLVIVK